MTAEQWVYTRLRPRLAGDALILAYDRTATTPAQTVPVPVFLGHFGDAIERALASGTSIYDALLAADYQEDGAGQPIVDRGYRRFFDQLKAAGLLT